MPCTHWGLDHCFKHDPTAILNFVLTLFLVFGVALHLWGYHDVLVAVFYQGPTELAAALAGAAASVPPLETISSCLQRASMEALFAASQAL